MKITNKHNLPLPLVWACEDEWTPNKHRMGVIDLINPPLMRYLRLEHWDDIEEDVSSMTWRLLGKSLHALLSNVTKARGNEVHFSEEKIEMPWGEFTLVGVPDLYSVDTENRLIDFKVTSVHSLLDGVRPEWVWQLNIYAYMLREVRGIEVDRLDVCVLYRDWSLGKANNPAYPQSEMEMVGIEKYDYEDIEDYIHRRMELHSVFPPIACEPEERWMKEKTYAVKIPNRRSALKLFPTEGEAREWIARQKINGAGIEERPAEAIRCKYYCNVSKFCPEYKEEEEDD